MAYLFLFISLLYPTLISAAVIWSAPMDGEGTSSWTIVASNNPQQKNNDNSCPDNDDCWAICGQNTNSNQAYIYRMASTKDYENIRLTLSIDPSSMSNADEYCSLRYSINGGTSYNSFTQFFTATDNDNYQSHTVSLPQRTWDNNNVGIMILALSGSGDCCYTSDLFLRGDKIPTTTTTKPPTQSPTTPSPLIYKGLPPGTSLDDYELAPNRGWLIHYSPTATKSPQITTSSDTGLTYHGPYIGDTNSSSFEVYNISQKFYCTQDSSVSIKYHIYFCETETSDYVKLYLNNMLKSTTTLAASSGTSYTDTVLNSVSPTECVAGSGWKYIGPVGPYTISPALSGVLLEVKYQISTTNNLEGIAISRTKITCTPLPTSNPTPSPTNFPTPAPTNIPSISPTDYPTRYPTYNPTLSPTQITINPTISPTNPTLMPTHNPTLSPTYNPTLTPSRYPTKQPSIFPTQSPTFKPTKSPTTPKPTLRIEVDEKTTNYLIVTEGGNIEHTETDTVQHNIDDKKQNDEANPLSAVTEMNNMIFLGIGVLISLCCVGCFFCILKKRNNNKNKLKFENDLKLKTQQRHIDNIEMIKVNNNLKNTNSNSMNGSMAIISKTPSTEHHNLKGTSFERINSGSNKFGSNVASGNTLSMHNVIYDMNTMRDAPPAYDDNAVLNAITAGGSDIEETDETDKTDNNCEDVTPPIDYNNDNDDIIDRHETHGYEAHNNNNNNNMQMRYDTKGYQEEIDTESDMDEGTPGTDDFIIHGDDEDDILENGYQTKSYNNDSNDIIMKVDTAGNQ